MTARTAAKALVTQVLKELIDAGNQYDAVIAIGPMIMMKFVCETTRPYMGIKTIVSMNTIMVDGTACAAAAVLPGGETKFACVDGGRTATSLILTVHNAPRCHVQGTGARAAVERREEHCNLFKKEVK